MTAHHKSVVLLSCYKPLVRNPVSRINFIPIEVRNTLSSPTIHNVVDCVRNTDQGIKFIYQRVFLCLVANFLKDFSLGSLDDGF